MGEHGPSYEQGDLFRDPDDVEDPKTAALRVTAEIAARRAEATQIEGDPLPEAAPDEPIATTSQERVAARAEQILARVRRDAAEVNSGVSPARAAETSEYLVIPEASVEGEGQIQAAQRAVTEAAAKAKTEADAPDKAARIEAAHTGSNQSRQVLEVIQKDKKKSEQDKQKSAIDLAYERARANTADARVKLEAAKAAIEADQNHRTALHEVQLQTASKVYKDYSEVQERLYKVKLRAAGRPEYPEASISEVEPPDQEEPNQNKGAWPKGELIETPEEARDIADKLAKGQRPPFVE